MMKKLEEGDEEKELKEASILKSAPVEGAVEVDEE